MIIKNKFVYKDSEGNFVDKSEYYSQPVGERTIQKVKIQEYEFESDEEREEYYEIKRQQELEELEEDFEEDILEEYFDDWLELELEDEDLDRIEY